MVKSKLLEKVSEQIKIRHYSRRTEKIYLTWIKNISIITRKSTLLGWEVKK